MDVNEWKVAQATAILDKFLALTYDPATEDPVRFTNAMFSLGQLTAIMAMSELAVVDRMAQEKS